MLLLLLEIPFTCFSSADGILSEISYILPNFNTQHRENIQSENLSHEIFNRSIHDENNRLQQIY